MSDADSDEEKSGGKIRREFEKNVNRQHRKQKELYCGIMRPLHGHRFINPVMERPRDVQEVLGNADYPYITAKECPLDKAAEDEIQVHLIEYKEIQKRCREFLVAEEQKKSGKWLWI